jgi:hypothetical protein
MAEPLKETLSAVAEKACQPVLLQGFHRHAGQRSASVRFLSQSRHIGLICNSNDSQLRTR